MNTKTLQTLSGKQCRLKNSQSGMTLVEVLISMFVLAIGVLALLSVQLRAVSGVREAESQTIVSQITQNLIEGMLINPVLTREVDASGAETGRTIKSYQHYKINADEKVTGAYKAATDTDPKMSKQWLRNAQIASFIADLSNALPDAEIHYIICQDDSGKAPEYKTAFEPHCSGTGDMVVKVLWLVDAEEKAASDLQSSDNFIIYTHQSRVTE